MRKFLIITLFLCANSMHASGTGYLGKCNTLTYKTGLALTPIFTLTLFENNYWSKYRDNYWWYTPEFEYNRCIKHNGSVGLGVSIINQVLYKNNSIYDNATFLPSNVYGTSFKLSYSWFSFKKHGSIAPIGSYWKLFAYAGYATIVDVNNFQYGTYKPVGFGGSFGKNYVLFDQFILNYEIEMNIPFTAMTTYSAASNLTSQPITDSNHDDFISNFFKLNIGIGYVFNDKFDFKR